MCEIGRDELRRLPVRTTTAAAASE